MKERQLGEKFCRKGTLIEVQLQKMGKNCSDCIYFDLEKCDEVKCCDITRTDDQNVVFIDITATLSESNKLLVERGLFKP
jgi:hypothetical protein